MKTLEAPVTVESFGEGTFETRLSGRRMSVGDVCAEHDIKAKARRTALNGNPATLDEPVQPGDLLTVISHIYGG